MALKRGIALGLSAWTSLLACAATWENADGVVLRYEASDGGATITECTLPSGFYGGLEIPAGLGENPVRSIGWGAFQGCRGLTSVTVPDSVTSIMGSAFAWCSELTTVTIPPSVTNIENTAFEGCSRLTAVTIPNGVTEIEDFTFRWCSGLTSVIIPPSVTNIGDSAFCGCRGLTTVTIPDGVMSIGLAAFRDCSGLTTVTIPKGVTSIDLDVFYGCSGLKSFAVAGNNPNYTSANGLLLTKDGKTLVCGLNGCVTIPDGVMSIGWGAFSGCSGLTSVTIPRGVTDFEDRAFWDCTNLVSVTIPSSVTNIGDYAFAGCSGLTSMTVPDSVTCIGVSAFRGCSGLASVAIPASVTNIEWSAFYDCAEIQTVWVDGDLTGLGSMKRLFFDSYANVTNVVLGAAVTSIPDEFFAGCMSLASVTIPDGVTEIGFLAFDGCANPLFDVTTIPGVRLVDGWAIKWTPMVANDLDLSGIRGLANGAFLCCTNLVSVTIPGSVSRIGDNAFWGCGCLSSATILDGVTSIGNQAFRRCGSLSSVTIPSSVKEIWFSVFDECLSIQNVALDGDLMNLGSMNGIFPAFVNVTNVVLGSGVTAIPDKFFAGCTSLVSVTIPNGVTEIGFWAFEGCSSLASVTIPPSVTEIWSGAFAGCTSLASMAIPTGVTYIASYVFEGCTNLMSVTLPPNVSDGIGHDAFEGCADALFDTTTIPGVRLVDGWVAGWTPAIAANLDLMGMRGFVDGAFYGCTNLVSVIIPEGVSHIRETAFFNCSSLRSVKIPSSMRSVAHNAFVGCVDALFDVETIPGVLLVDGWVAGDGGYMAGGWTSEIASDPDLTGARGLAGCAFWGCTNLVSVTIPSTVTSIGYNAFWECGALSSVTISEGVTLVDDRAFWDCTNLVSVTLPASVTNLGEGVFNGCANLARITFKGAPPAGTAWMDLVPGEGIDRSAITVQYDGRLAAAWREAAVRLEELGFAVETYSVLPDLAVSFDGFAPTSWMPGDTVTVVAVESNIGDGVATAPWIDRLILGDGFGDQTVLKTWQVSEDLAPGDAVSRRVSCVIPELVPSEGSVHLGLHADIGESVAEVDEVSNNVCRVDGITLGKRLYLTADSVSVAENAATGVRFTVRRSGRTAEPLTVAIGNTDVASVSAPVAVTIPAGSVGASFTVNPIDNAVVDGTRIVNVSVAADGCAGASVLLTVLDDEVPKLTVTLDKTSIREGDGVITVTVFREGSTEGDLIVYLSGTSSGRVSYPSSVVIPAGESSVTFEISVPDNDTAQVAQDLTLRASSAGYRPASVSYRVEDDDVPGVTLSLAPEVVSEGAGARAIYATLTRSDTNQIAQAVRVRLTASEANQLILPSEVTIPKYTMAVRFAVGVVDNALDDGDREVTINGAIVIESCGCNGQPSNGDVIQAVVGIIDDDGPALALKAEPATMKEGLAPAGYLVLSHNSTLAEDLTVRLWVDAENESEVEIPGFATIPAGETSVRIPVTTLDDGVEDGSKLVSVYAEVDGEAFAPASTWVLVTDQNLPDLIPVDLAPQAAAVTVGERISLTFAVTNAGYAASSRGVAYSVYCVKGKSAMVGDAGILVASGTTDAPVGIGASAVVATTITVPDVTGDCRFAVVVDPDDMISELDNANNAAYSAVVSVSPSYVVQASVAEETFLQGAEVAISGLATKSVEATSAANVAVEVYVLKDGLRRTLMATTDAQGRFSVTFKPTSSEAGHYIVGTSFPGMGATAEQDSFDILGMKRTSGDYYLEYNNITLGDALSRTVNIRNLSPVALTGLTAEIVGVVAGCEVEVSDLDAIPGGKTLPLTVTLRGTELTDGTDYKEFVLRLVSAEGARLDIPVLYFVQSPQAHIKARPASINTTMTVGQTRAVDFTIINDGKGDSGKITILATSFPWLSIEGGGEIANLASNESAVVTLKLTPEAGDVELNNRYTGSVAVNCETGRGCLVPFAFKAVSESTGTVKVDVIDGYTYYLDSAPHVSNATVRISNIYTGEVVAEGRTGLDGTWVSGEIGEGTWQLAVLADRHRPYYDTVTVSPGMETALPAIYLDAQSVKISYTVTPTNIVDTYVVSLVTEYETAVPEPVLVTTFSDRVPDLKEGQSFAFNVYIVNKGLVAAHDVSVEMPTIDDWQFAVGDSGFSLAPDESVTVPVVVRRPAASARRRAATRTVTDTKVDCVDIVRTRSSWQCGPDRRWHEYKVQLPTERICTTKTYRIDPDPDGDDDGPTPPGKPSRSPGPEDGTYGPGGGGSGKSRITISRTDCNPCDNFLSKLADTIDDTKRDQLEWGWAFARDTGLGLLPFSGCVDFAVNTASMYGPLGEAIDDWQSKSVVTKGHFQSYSRRGSWWKGIWHMFADLTSCAADVVSVGLAGRVSIVVQAAAKATKEIVSRIDDIIGDFDYAYKSFMGMSDLGYAFDRQSREYLNCQSRYAQAAKDLSIALRAMKDLNDINRNIYSGPFADVPYRDALTFWKEWVTVIGDDWTLPPEAKEALVANRPESIPEQKAKDFIQRIEDGNAAWEDAVTDVDSTMVTEGFNIGEILKCYADIKVAGEYARAHGYDSIEDMFEKSLGQIEAFGKDGSRSVCAKVTLELSQEVTMTREAFLGTLNVSNGHGSKPITDMKMEIEITDENGDRCEELFQQDSAGLVTMSGTSILDGGISLAANASGSASVLFTPSTKAAPMVPKVYYFGGTVVYTDPFSGETARVPLQPAVPVTVKPSPELTFHYFLQRDVIGDDPFTKDVVEESEPAEVALLVQNKGYGDAKNVTIKTAEPVITENEKELKVGFDWVGAALDGAETRLPYRNVDLGVVPAQGCRLAQWWLTSTLQGHFTKIDGSYTRLNGNGNPDFDLIKDVRTHMLVRSVSTGGDPLPGFLVSERRFDGQPDVLYTAKGDVRDVVLASSASVSAHGATATFTVVPGATGWNYASCRRPFGAYVAISRVRRADGTEVPLRNVWFTTRTFEDGVDPIAEDRIHIADEMAYGAAATYSIDFVETSGTASRLTVESLMAAVGPTDAHPASVTVVFSRAIDVRSFDMSTLALYRNGTSVEKTSALSISPEGTDGDRFVVSGFDCLGAVAGTYSLTVDASGVVGVDGTAGTGSKSVLWTLAGDTTPPAQIADLVLSPDGGFSDTDGVTYTGDLTVSGTLPEDGLTLEIVARYVGSGETVLAALPASGGGALPAGAFSQDISLSGFGNVTLVVRLTDAAGNVSETEKNVYVDGIALTGALTGAADDEGDVTASATLAFSAQVMDADVTLDKFSLTRDGEPVALAGVTLDKINETTFALAGLDALCAEDGAYALRFDGSAVRKYTSGLTMGGSLALRWRHMSPDREPPTITAVLFDGEVPQTVYTNVFSSVSVTFSEPVNVPELIANGLIGKAARIDLLDAANAVTSSVMAVSAPTWDAASNTLAWQIDPLAVPAGRTRLVVDAGLVTDEAGNGLSAAGFDAASGLRRFKMPSATLAQVTAQAMPMWSDGSLYVGEKTAGNTGKIRCYAADGTWTYLQSEGVDIEIPAQGCQGASVAFADLDGDGTAEIYVGTAGGDVLKYPGGETVASLGVSRAVPFACDMDGDGRDELVVGGMDGRIRVLSRDAESGVCSATLLLASNGLPLTVPNGRAAPVVADVNHDGYADILSGDTAGNVWTYLGGGSSWCAQPVTVFTNDISLADRSRLGWGDVDGDGIKDLVIGRSDGSVAAWLGAETPSPVVPFEVWAPPAITLAQALNADGLVWATGGAADWQPEWSTDANDGLHHARSGIVGDDANSWLETSVDGAGTLSFAWRSSTEARYDMLQLILDGEVKGTISGETPWTTNVISLAAGAHTIRWNYRKSRSGTAGADTVWLDSVTWTADVPPTLAEVLNPDLFWATSGDVEWVGVRKTSILGPRDDWATVGGLADCAASRVETAVYGAGVLTFDWSVSCENGYDWLDFLVDGKIRESITGETDWKTVRVEFADGGKHVLQWEYWKDERDESGLAGENRARLDDVRWTPVSAESQHTATTPESVPFADIRTLYRSYWLAAEGDYEAAAMMTGRNGCAIWQSYVAGLDPDDARSVFTAEIEVVDGKPVVTWQPDTPELRATRLYTTYGKKTLLDREWTPVTDGNRGDYNFFKVEVKMK